MRTATLTSNDLRIQDAVLGRPTDADAATRHIDVVIAGGRATLTGTVRTWFVRNAVAEAVAEAPGVTEVDNRLQVEAPYLELPDPSAGRRSA